MSIDLSACTTIHQDEQYVGRASAKGILYEVGEYLPDSYKAYKDANGLHVCLSKGQWAHLRIVDNSGPNLFGYSYALVAGTGPQYEPPFAQSRWTTVLDTGSVSSFKPGELIENIQDTLNDLLVQPA